METAQLPADCSVTLCYDELAEHVLAEYRRRMYVAGDLVRTRVQQNISEPTPPSSHPGQYPHADTGVLRDSIFLDVDEDLIAFTVGTPLAYGMILEEGSAGGQIIYPRAGSLLSWVDPRTGERRFAKWVRLGPIQGRSFLRRTLTEMAGELEKVLSAPIPDADFGLGA